MFSIYRLIFVGDMLPVMLIISIAFIFGVLGNCWVVWGLIAALRRQWHRPTSATFEHISLFIVSLSIVDLLVLCTIPLLLTYFVTGNWPFGYAICKLYWTIENVNKLLSVALLTVMSFERYVTVCRSFRWRWCRTRTCVYRVLAVCTTLVILSMLPIIYYSGTSRQRLIMMDGNGINEEVGEDNSTTTMTGPPIYRTICRSDIPDHIMPYFIGYMLTGGFFVPAIATTLCYFFIIKHVRLHLSRCNNSLSSYMYRPIFSILRVVIFHFVCWTPFWLSLLLPIVIQSRIFAHIDTNDVLSDWLPFARLLVSSLPYINSAGNWIFYALLNRELRYNISGGNQSHRVRSSEERQHTTML